MPPAGDLYAQSAESLVVRLAHHGDSRAFEELVRRRQSWIRNLMRRLCGDAALADDLAQQVLLQLWHRIGQLREPERFAGWLKRMAVNTWLQHVRAKDALDLSDAIDAPENTAHSATGMAIDLDRALATLAAPVRLCIVLSYHERMSHAEIAELTSLPLGTVKSHIRRGTERLQSLLSDYVGCTTREVTR